MRTAIVSYFLKGYNMAKNIIIVEFLQVYGSVFFM